MIYQRKAYPGYLYSEKNSNISLLFKFEFGKVVTADQINNEKKANLRRRYELKEVAKNYAQNSSEIGTSNIGLYTQIVSGDRHILDGRHSN